MRRRDGGVCTLNAYGSILISKLDREGKLKENNFISETIQLIKISQNLIVQGQGESFS